MKILSCLALSVVLFLIGCGGDRVAARANGSSSSNDSEIAADAVSESPWSNEEVVTPTSEKQSEANNNIQSLIADAIDEEDESSKKERSNSTNFSGTVTGPRGGTGTISGTREVSTTPGTFYPRTTSTEATIIWDGYEGNEFSVNGQTEYSGSTTHTSLGNFTRTFTTHGGYSYKDADGVYSFITQMDVTITCVDFVRSVTFTYVVNGKTITGSF